MPTRHVCCSLAVLGVLAAAPARAADDAPVPVVFTGGHDIGPNDFGRPVVLIAAALEVPPDVFREAFAGVTPARGGPPTADEARKNKAALMKVLGPRGVTNDRLDTVSNYYRYRPGEGRLWPTKPAKAHAVVTGAAVRRVVVTEPGSGYCSPPKATVAGFDGVAFRVTLVFSTDFAKNGSVGAVEVVAAK